MSLIRSPLALAMQRSLVVTIFGLLLALPLICCAGAFLRGWIAFKQLFRARWSPLQLATTVRACTGQFALHAFAAEGALEAADHRLPGSGRKVLAAVFAIRSEFEHWASGRSGVIG